MRLAISSWVVGAVTIAGLAGLGGCNIETYTGEGMNLGCDKDKAADATGSSAKGSSADASSATDTVVTSTTYTCSKNQDCAAAEDCVGSFCLLRCKAS